jgi:hypothetical protein
MRPVCGECCASDWKGIESNISIFQFLIILVISRTANININANTTESNILVTELILDSCLEAGNFSA